MPHTGTSTNLLLCEVYYKELLMSYGLITSKTVELPEIPVKKSIKLSAGKSAIIVVDMQNDFVKPGGSLVVPDAMATVPAIQDLVARGREKGVRIAYTQDTHLEGDKEWTIWPRHTEQGTWGWRGKCGDCRNNLQHLRSAHGCQRGSALVSGRGSGGWHLSVE